MSQEIEQATSQPEVKSSETYLNPVKVRSQKQIEWIRELGKKFQEFKKLKTERNLKKISVDTLHEEITSETEKIIRQLHNASKSDSNNYYYFGGALILIIGGSIIIYLNLNKVYK
jgi:hypothetical protein